MDDKGYCSAHGETHGDCYGESTDDEMFECECGADFFTFKNNKLYCKCGKIYNLKDGIVKQVDSG